jgi:hypothetical protein
MNGWNLSSPFGSQFAGKTHAPEIRSLREPLRPAQFLYFVTGQLSQLSPRPAVTATAGNAVTTTRRALRRPWWGRGSGMNAR